MCDDGESDDVVVVENVQIASAAEENVPFALGRIVCFFGSDDAVRQRIDQKHKSARETACYKDKATTSETN